MKKLLPVILVIIAVLLYWTYVSFFKKEPLCFAVAGPLTEPEGQMMLKGISLCADKLNSQGGINGRKIRLIPYDDKNDPELAQDIAQVIVQKNEVLLVMGHYYGLPSAAAGKIYKRNEIPAITASAMLIELTRDNEWYFRTIPNEFFQGSVIASYVNKSLRKESASIVFTDDFLGASLADKFEKTAKTLGMAIIKKCRWNPNDKDADKQVKTILSELADGDQPEILFFATTKEESAMLVAALKDSGNTTPIIGSNVFGRNLLEDIKKVPMKELNPDLYTDGIHYAIQFMTEIGNPSAVRIAREFAEKYGQELTSVAACYYDALLVAAEAVKKANIKGLGHINEDRRNIRDALISFYSEETSVNGITGNIYFDENREFKRPYAICVYQNQKILPAYFQYRKISSVSGDVLKKILSGEIIETDGVLMSNTRIVFTDLNNLEITHVNLKDNRCSAVFQLRFRYSGEFDDTNIEFTNSVKPIKLGKPISENKKDGITTRTYWIQGEFKADFDFHAYPFDAQSIPIRFRHNSSGVVYIPDAIAPPPFVNSSAPGWGCRGISLYPDMISKVTSLGNPIYFKSGQVFSYSHFNADVLIQKKFYPLWIIITLLPVCIMLLGLYRVFRKHDPFATRVKIFMAVFIINFALHLMLLSEYLAEHLIAMDYVFITVYVLTILSAFMSVFRSTSEKMSEL